MAGSNVDLAFRPMDDLVVECVKVEMQLHPHGPPVVGWLFCGHPMIARTFWMYDERLGAVSIEPIGWREIQPSVAQRSAA